MNPTKGLFTDSRPLQQPDGTYPHGKNGLQFDLRGAVVNEEGFQRLAAVVPYRLIGVVETDKYPVLISTDNTNSAIGFLNVDTGNYVPIFDDSALPYKLGFNTAWPVTGVSQRNYKNELVCAITDFHTFPMYFNADNLDVTRLEDWNLFPYFRVPTIGTTVETGGRLLPGTYYITGRYQRNDGTTGAYFPVNLGRTVPSNNGQAGFTDKELVITIDNADTSYDYIVLAVVSRISGVTSAVELEPIPINRSGPTITSYNGEAFTQVVSMEEILTPPPVYNRIGRLGQLNDALYAAVLKKKPEILDMQPYANLVEVEFESKLLNGKDPGLAHVTGEEKGFMHEEVYALYIRYRLAEGGFTKCYHIPGIEPIGGQLLNSPKALAGGFTGAVFQTEDTITTFNAGTKTGTPGCWKNQTELYPDVPEFGMLANSPVRHHKMPSIHWCKQNFYSSNPNYGRTELDILGIKLNNVTIPAQYIGVIDGYELLYAKRSIANMTVYGQSILLHGAVGRDDQVVSTGNVDILTTGANWNSGPVTRSSTSYDRKNDLYLRQDTMRFHAFDVLFNKPGIRPTYISSQLYMRKEGLKAQSLVQDGIGPDESTTPTIHLLDYTATPCTITAPANQLLRGIKNGGSYLPFGTDVNRFINTRHEYCFAGELKGANWPLNPGLAMIMTSNVTLSPGNTPVDYISDFIETYLINLKALKTDLYRSFYSQVLITAGNAQNLTSNTTYFGGDTYIGNYTFHTYGRHDVPDYWEGYFGGGPNCGKKVIHRFVCEMTSNIHLRYELPGNVYSKWFPNTSLVFGDGTSYPEYWDRTLEPNQFGYNKDLNALNDLVAGSIYSPYTEVINDFPHRIHRGGKLSKQTKFRNWRNFLPLDYYEMQKNMGYISNIEGIDDSLLIHCENALFRTQDKAKLDAGLLSVTLGAGDIFQFEPQEIQSAKLGYAGTQHNLACVNTPAGYVFIDAKQGEIYLFKGELKNISGGLTRFFRDAFRDVRNNPFTGNGITVGWHQKHKRILVTVKKRVPPAGVPIKQFENTQAFWDNLEIGDIIQWNGQYIEYTDWENTGIFPGS